MNSATAVAETIGESNLVNHARRELERAGMYDDDADYGKGVVAGVVLDLVRTLSRSDADSGAGVMLVLSIFERVARFKTLSPLTADPEEWMNVTEYGCPEGVAGIWQSRRTPSAFSNDGGKTYYDLDVKAINKPTLAIPTKPVERKTGTTPLVGTEHLREGNML